MATRLRAVAALLAAGCCRLRETYAFQAPGMTVKVDDAGAIFEVAFTEGNQV